MAYIDDVYLVVNIAPVGIPTYVRLSQNENGRRLYFAVTGGEIPSGSTATMSGTKPDGVVYSKAGTISGNTVTFNEDIQLTAVAGEWPAKIVIVNGGQTVMTARIRFVIDADTVAAGAVPSDSQLEGLVAQAAAYAEAAKDGAFYGSPLVASTAAEMTDQTRVYVYTGSESGYTAGNWYYWNGSAWTSGGVYNATAVSTDTTLSVAGKAADAKATGDAIRAVTIPTDKTLTQSDKPADAKVVGDELSDLKDDFSELGEIVDNIDPGLPEEAKAALLACFRGVAWVSQDSQTLYDNLENALNTTAKVLSISAVFEQGSAVIYPEDTLDSLRSFLTVTATLDNGKTLPVLNYDLSGQLTVGTSVITVTYKSKTTTFNVVVGEPEWGSDYTWLYKPSENGLLSVDENVSAMVAINGTFGTETLSGDVLNITTPYTGNAGSGNIYKLIPLVCTNAVLKAKVKFNSLAESLFASGLRLQLSNGTKGAQIFAYKHSDDGDYRISTHNEGDQVKLAEIQLNRWYVISCEIKPNNTQTLKIDDAVYNINALASYANTESRVIVQQPGGATDTGSVDVDIAWIAFKNNA